MRRLWLLILLICGALTGAPDDSLDRMTADLVRAGFENIAVSVLDTGHLQVRYENRIYRDDVKAAGRIMHLLKAGEAGFGRVDLVPCRFGLAVGSIQVGVADYERFIRGEMEAKAFAKTLVVGNAPETRSAPLSEPQNKSFFKLDATITVDHRIQLGQYDDRFKFFGQVQPGLSSHLWPGNRVYAEAAIPFYDEIGLYDKGVRLGRMGISQVFRLPYGAYAAVQGGVFMPERWGVSMEIASFWAKRRFLSGAQWDDTGFFYDEQGKWLHSNMELKTFKFYTQYFLPWFDMMAGLDWSRYILGDQGWRLTVRRTFAETDVEIYFANTDRDEFGGVRLFIPLPPAKRMRPARVRISWPDQYMLGYRATSEAYSFGGPLQTGLVVDTGFSLTDYVKDFSPAHILNNIEKWKKGELVAY